MKAGQKVLKYIRDDNAHSYGLDEEVGVVITGDDVTFCGGKMIEAEYTTKDGSLKIAPCEQNLELAIRLTAFPFAADTRLWNGPDIIADNTYRAMLASLFHDLIWEHGDELAKAWGVTKQDVLRWGDGVLYALWMYASEDSIRGRIEARVAWQVCEFSRGWYHRLKKLLGLHSILFALLFAGCGTPPDWTVAEITGTNAVLRAMGKDKQEICLSEGVTNENVGAGAEIVGKTDTFDYSSLDWRYGGFSGAKAKPVDGAEIGSLKVTADGLSYKWAQGGCENLGASSSTDYSQTLACLFCRIGGKWQGGKIDWISTSRTTRDFKNVRKGYAGWRKDAIEAADAYAFVICSKDGKRRSNIALFAK